MDKTVKNITGAQVSLMIDFGKVDLSDIPHAFDSQVPLYRIVAHKLYYEGIANLMETEIGGDSHEQI